MTVNDVKRILYRCRNAERKLEALEDLRKQIYDENTRITSSYEPSAGSGTKDPHRKIDRLAVATDEVNRQWDKLIDIRNETLRYIDMIEDPIKSTILMDRYVKGMTWEAIAVHINYSFMHTTRLHGYALKELSEKM